MDELEEILPDNTAVALVRSVNSFCTTVKNATPEKSIKQLFLISVFPLWLVVSME